MTSAVYTTYFWIQDQSGNANTFTVTIAGSSANVPSFDVYYSTDLTTWTRFGNSQTGPRVTLSVNFTGGSKVYLKAVTNRWGLADSAQSLFGFTSINANKMFEVGGNIMSLIYGDQFVGKKTFPDDTIPGIFNGLFVNKTNLVNAEELVLPVTHSTSTNGLSRCYRSLFDGCAGLTNGPMIDLRAKNNNDCPVAMSNMFRNCTSLKTIRTCLQFTASRYDSAFSGITSIGMLYNYSGTDFTTILPQNWAQTNIISMYLPTYDRIVDWNSNISGNITKVVDSQNRTIWQKISPEYAVPFYVENITQNNETLSIQKDNNIAPTLTIEYSLDKSTWSTLGNTSTNSLTYSLNPGDKLYLRCSTTKWADYTEGEGVTYGNNTITGVSKVGGNIMSLLYGNSFTGNEVLLRDSQDEFHNIFSNNTSLQSADSLLLPATTLHLHSYMNMFENCTNLISAPDLNPAVLANDSCVQMFEGCSSLQSGPIIYAQELRSASCIQMFVNCTSLNSITCLATDISASDCTFQWMLNVGSAGTFYCANGMSSIWSSGVSGIPSGWTVVEV